MMLSADEEDLEQLIKGGPFELGLYADKLGSHMFGIDSVAQVCRVCLALSVFIAHLQTSPFPSYGHSCSSPIIRCHASINRFTTVHPTLS